MTEAEFQERAKAWRAHVATCAECRDASFGGCREEARLLQRASRQTATDDVVEVLVAAGFAAHAGRRRYNNKVVVRHTTTDQMGYLLAIARRVAPGASAIHYSSYTLIHLPNAGDHRAGNDQAPGPRALDRSGPGYGGTED